MDVLDAAGFGLDYGTVRLSRTTEDAVAAGARLRDDVAATVCGVAADVAHIGSTSVVGLLAKPIVDLAVGLGPGDALQPVADRLRAAGWLYRGDAGDHGGHVFVLESRARHRVAHAHVVEYGGTQWRNYLRLRELLRNDARARLRYEEVKRHLAERYRTNRPAYTDGKTEVVRALLATG